MQDLSRFFYPFGRAALGALFLIPVTLLFHAFWSADAASFQNQLTQFLKNAAIFGGMLLVIEREGARTAVKPSVVPA